MEKIKYYESSQFPVKKIKDIKGDYTIVVVFSTFGTREAELIYDKISLIRKELGSIVDGIYLSHRRENDTEELTGKHIDADENDDEDDDYFDKAWNNWSSRRRCESAHRAGKMEQFKKVSKPKN